MPKANLRVREKYNAVANDNHNYLSYFISNFTMNFYKLNNKLKKRKIHFFSIISD
jgi:hypothetical protein